MEGDVPKHQRKIEKMKIVAKEVNKDVRVYGEHRVMKVVNLTEPVELS